MLTRHDIQAILFDLDGTLVDSLKDLQVAVNHALAVLGQEPHDLDRVQTFIGNGVRALLARSLLGREVVPGDASEEDRQLALEALIERASDDHGESFQTAYEAFAEYYDAHLTDHTVPYPGVREALESLRSRGLPLAVVSNKPEGYTRQILADLELEEFFAHVVGGDTTPHPKPHPAPVLHAIEALDLEAPRTLMLGDSPPDLLSGIRAGCTIAAVTYGFVPRERLDVYRPAFYLDDLRELL